MTTDLDARILAFARATRSVLGHWILLLACVVGGAGAGVAATARETPTYTASTTVFFALSRGDSISELAQGASYTQSLMQSYAAVATKPTVLDPVIRRLGLDTSTAALAQRVTAKVQPGTVLLDITVTDASARTAAALADAVGDQFSTAVLELSPVGASGAKLLDVTTIATASVPSHPVPAHRARTWVLGVLGGLVLGLLVAVAREASSPRVRRADDVARVLDVPVLGVVPAGVPLIAPGQEDPAAEAFRRLRTHLLAQDRKGEVRTVVFSDLAPAAHPSVAAQLAVALSETETDVVLVEAALGAPRLAVEFAVAATPGLADVLDGAAAAAALQPWAGSTLDLLVAGAARPNPGRLLSVPALAAALSELRSRYDLVLVDTAGPPRASTTGQIVGLGDAVVLTVPTRSTTRRELMEAAQAVEGAGGTVLGVVLLTRRPR